MSKFDEILRLIPTVLEQRKEYKRRDIVKAVKEYLMDKGTVSQEELKERLESRAMRLDNRIEWAIHNLFREGKLERTKSATYKLAIIVPEEEYKDEAITSHLTEEQSPQEQIDRALKSLIDDLKFRLLDLLKNLPSDKFERFVLASQ